MPAQQLRLPIGDCEFALQIALKTAEVSMINRGGRHKLELVALLSETEGKFLILIAHHSGFKPTVLQEHVAPVAGRVGVDEINPFARRHAAILVAIFKLDKARDQAALARKIGALDP